MTKKQKTTLLIIAGLFIGSYVIRNMYLSAMRAQQHAMRQRQKPAPKANPEPNSPEAVLAAELATMGKLSGVWEGHAPVPARVCNLRLELTQKEPGQFTGYSRFNCMPIESITNPKDVNIVSNYLNNLKGEAAILTGTVEKGAIHFHADKNIGTDSQGCAISELIITPFGTGAVAAEWKEGTCQGGNMMMQRALR